MPKKTQRNAFYFFMKELEPTLRREGRVFPNGMADVVPLAHPRWKALSAKEKERFETMAKEFKAKMRGVEGDKYRMDTSGNIIAYRKDPRKEMEDYFHRMAQEVMASWPPGQEIINENFFLINVQSLCETEEGIFLPCEIACLQFSLQRGIIKTFHRFIDPGRIPTGYLYTCIKKSEMTHQIPCENFEEATADYSWLWTQLKNFVNPNNEMDVYPAVYCRPSVYRETRKCLEWLHSMAMDRGTCKLGRILNLEKLLMDLYAHIDKGKGIYQAVDILGTSSYDFVPKHRCKYHEELECKFCSLGILNRYAYSMFSELAVVYDFELTPRHLPERTEQDLAVTVIPPPKQSIFPQPQVNRGQPCYRELANKEQDRNYQREDGAFASRDIRYYTQANGSDDQDEQEEIEDMSLRLPKATGTGVGIPQLSAQRSRPPVGGGRAMTKENSGSEGSNSAGVSRAQGRGSVVTGGPGVMPGGASPFARGMSPSVALRANPPHARPGLSSTGCGRGVLAPLVYQLNQFKLPVGRGYAPHATAESVADRLQRMQMNTTVPITGAVTPRYPTPDQ